MVALEPDNNCSETYAALRIIGPSVMPGALTRTTGILPSFTISIGDVRPKGTRPRTEGIWATSSKGLCISNELEDHILEILNTLPPTFRELVPNEARCEIHCVWRSSTGHGGPVLSSKTLARLGDFGLDLDFDFYSDV